MKCNEIVVAGLLFIISPQVHAQPTPASPVKTQVRWEYALLFPSASRVLAPSKAGGSRHVISGMEVLYPNQPRVFLEKQYHSDEHAFLLNVLQRMGSKGWEITSVPTYRGPNYYILKRRK